MPAKSCQMCGEEFTKPANISLTVWAKRRFCSRKCAAQHRRPHMEVTRTCLTCRSEFSRPRGDRKGAATWRKRKFCSTACSEAYHLGERNGNWKAGGSFKMPGGYLGTLVYPDHPLYESMGARRGPDVVARHILEHRLAMAEHLGRPLTARETVHHINGDRTDNRVENLQLRTGKHGNGAKRVCADCGSEHIREVPL